MKRIGLLMVADDNDILDRTLEHNAEHVDWFYALDGSRPANDSQRLILDHPKCRGYWTDADAPYSGPPRDGWRQLLHEAAVEDFGPDNWFLLLHGDELWPEDLPDLGGDDVDGVIFRLPFFLPRADEPWRDDLHPLDQLRWRLGPGWPEFRMFRGREGVAYDPEQHFNVIPSGIRMPRIVSVDVPIEHYPYRSPSVQRMRAARHHHTGFDPDNFRHILNDDAVYWTDEMIAAQLDRPQYSELRDMVAA